MAAAWARRTRPTRTRIASRSATTSTCSGGASGSSCWSSSSPRRPPSSSRIRQPKQYEASADLIYEKQLDISNPLTGQSYTDANERYVQLASVGSIIASPDMQARAERELEAKDVALTGFEVDSEVVSDDAGGTSTTASNVVRITATSGDPELAAAAANAYAVSFVTYRRDAGQGPDPAGHRGDPGPSWPPTRAPRGRARTTSCCSSACRTCSFCGSRPPATSACWCRPLFPTSPFSPQPLRSAILGLGRRALLLAIGLAFLLEQFDTRVRRADEIAGILRQPILGRIPRISHKLLNEGAVVALKHPDGQVAEAFRMVRTNLEFLSVDQAVRSVLVTSCVQGEGKSVAVANLAVTLTMTGKKVVVVDADLRRPRQHEYFGLSNERGLSTVASGRDKLFDTLVPVEVAHLQNGQATPDFSAWAEGADARSRLYVLPSGPTPPNPGEIVASQRLSAVIDQLAFEADIVLVDTPAMLPVGDTSAIAPKVDGLIFLVDMHVIKKPQLATAAEQLRAPPGAHARHHRARRRRRRPVRRVVRRLRLRLRIVVRPRRPQGALRAPRPAPTAGHTVAAPAPAAGQTVAAPAPAAGQTVAAPALDPPQPLDGSADV